jgi:hypothetical protein
LQRTAVSDRPYMRHMQLALILDCVQLTGYFELLFCHV